MPRAQYVGQLRAVDLNADSAQVPAEPRIAATSASAASSGDVALAEFVELPPRGMIRAFLAACLIVLSGLLWGCASGFNCPFDRPSCCDNVVFGCGTFDLPSGCSCSDYFLRSFNGTTLPQTPAQSVMISARSRVRAQRVAAAGTWRATAQKTDFAACPLFPNNVTATLLLRETGSRVSMKLLGYGTMRGLRARNTVRAKGAYKVSALGCVAFVQSQLSLTNPSGSAYTVTLNWSCQSKANSCSATYQGSIKKLG
jgi:hypothetical protein